MPELPEAELTREKLSAWLLGRVLRRVSVPDPLTRRGQEEAAIRKASEGRRVSAVLRRGKFLRIALAPPGSALISHLGMSGRWLLGAGSGPASGPKHPAADPTEPPAVRAALWTDEGLRVLFSDRRRFGHFSLCLPEDDERLARLGPEPLGRAFTGRRLAGLLAASRRAVKALLMEQDRIAGIGNIQATEALWRAGIHPARPANTLGPTDAARLHRAIRATLRRTIREARGIEVAYVGEGAAGRRSASDRFRTYGREGEWCARCRSRRIERTVISGRSSFFCPRCQPPDGI